MPTHLSAPERQVRNNQIVIAYRDENQSVEAISKTIGVSQGGVYHILDKAGVPRRQMHGSKSKDGKQNGTITIEPQKTQTIAMPRASQLPSRSETHRYRFTVERVVEDVVEVEAGSMYLALKQIDSEKDLMGVVSAEAL